MYNRLFFWKKEPSVFFMDAHIISNNDEKVSLYISIWICFKYPTPCLDLAGFYLKDAGYEIREIVISPQQIRIKDYKGEYKSLLKYHYEAIKLGRSLVFHHKKISSPYDLI